MWKTDQIAAMQYVADVTAWMAEKATGRKMETPKLKSGAKTTEFWLTLIATGVAGGLALVGEQPWVKAVLGIIAVVGPIMYGLGRAFVKREQEKVHDIVSDGVEVKMDAALKVLDVLVKEAQKNRKAKDDVPPAGND